MTGGGTGEAHRARRAADCFVRAERGAKQVYRGPDGDVLALRDEPAPPGHHALLQPVMRHGRPLCDPEPLATIQRRCRACLAWLPPAARACTTPAGTGPDQRAAQEPPGPHRTRHHPADRRAWHSRDHLPAAPYLGARATPGLPCRGPRRAAGDHRPLRGRAARPGLPDPVSGRLASSTCPASTTGLARGTPTRSSTR